MKKIFILIYLMILGGFLTGCNYTKEVKKPTVEMFYGEWYNLADIPNMEKPFAESYDGSYKIEIDENNNVTFIIADEEPLIGKIEFEVKTVSIAFEIKFESKTAIGNLTIRNDAPYLNLLYDKEHYYFSDSKAISYEEYVSYRNNFNAFLRNSFINNNYPTLEEAENNPLYAEYTNYMHIDPCCNGPKVYTSVDKVLIEKDLENELVIVTYNDGKTETLDLFQFEFIALVKIDGSFEKLDEIIEGECFLTSRGSLYYFEGINE